MTRPKILVLGISAKFSFPKCLLHPEKEVQAIYNTIKHGERLEEMIFVREGEKEVKGKRVLCVIFTHDVFRYMHLHTVK